MDYAQQQRQPGKHLTGITIVIIFHVLLGWALASGLARKVVKVVKGPLETKIIEEWLNTKRGGKKVKMIIPKRGQKRDLVKMAAERGRATRPDIKLGICGEHGGDPESIHKCEKIGLDYVSCSPFRVPVARLEAGRALLYLF